MRTIRAALLMTACLSGTAAAADPPSAASSTEAAKKADALFHEGVRFVGQQSWKEAEEKFLGAWALNPTYDVANNLGQTQYRLGKYRDAAEHLAFALKNWPIIGKKEPREGAQKRFEEVRGHVGAVKIQVSVAGATVFVDGKEIGKSPIEIDVYVEPGKRTIEAKLTGYEDAKQTIEATAGGEQSVTLALAASASAAKVVPVGSASASAAPPPSGSVVPPPVPQKRSPVPAVVGGGLAVGAVAVGVGLFVASSGKKDDAVMLDDTIDKAHGRCVGPGPIDKRCAEIISITGEGDTFHNIAVGAFVGAGVLAVGTLAYLLWPAPKAKKARLDVHAAPVLGAGHGGMIIGGAF